MEENITSKLERCRHDMSPSTLAYIGDAVYELFVRTRMATRYNISAHELNKKTVALVNAKAQAEMLKRLEGMLNEEEADIVRRGRNTKSSNVPRHTSPIQYRYATGFEALIGYIYLKGDHDRLRYLLEMCLNDDNLS
ncbi:MAG: mini-ribonuclease [Clostridiales bacterium]|jgi:ribonuclease-3 family protein|nr:mini-ribonuclease [Clostridiales bacterium]